MLSINEGTYQSAGSRLVYDITLGIVPKFPFLIEAMDVPSLRLTIDIGGIWHPAYRGCLLLVLPVHAIGASMRSSN